MTHIEELALHLFGQLRDGDLKRSDIELIEDAIGNAYEEGRNSVPSRITELEQALRLHLAVSPDDPLLIEPVEQEVVRLRARVEEAKVETLARIEAMEKLRRGYDESIEQLNVKLEGVEGERDSLKEEIEIGLQLTGSFFEALKPLKLTSIHVQNPGRHITDLITQLTASQARVQELEQQVFDYQNRPDSDLATIAELESRVSLEQMEVARWKELYGTIAARVREVEERLAIMTDAACQFEQQAIENEPKGDCEETTERNPQSLAAWKRKVDTITARCAQVENALGPFISGGEWGKWLAWLVEGAPTRQEGIAAAKIIVSCQCAADQALTPTTPAGEEEAG